MAASIKLTVNAAQGFARVFASGYKKGKWDIPAIVEYGQESHSISKNPFWGMRGKTHPGARGKFFMQRAGLEGAIYANNRMNEKVRLAIKDSGFR